MPGITAALAAASALRLPLTHRDHAHSVRFVTGHAHDGALADDLDWKDFAGPQTTFIFYVGGRAASAIADRLLLAGLDPSTPAVAVAGISLCDERRWYGTLADLHYAAGLTDHEQPVLIRIGKVFGERTRYADTHARPAVGDTDRAVGDTDRAVGDTDRQDAGREPVCTVKQGQIARP